jgi:hypothetical protein
MTMRRALKRRIHAVEERLGWRPWLARPMAVWPLYAMNTFLDETLVRPASFEKLSNDQVDELWEALRSRLSE